MKILPSPIFAGACGLGDHVTTCCTLSLGTMNLDLHLGNEIDDVGRSAVDFFLTAGPSKAF